MNKEADTSTTSLSERITSENDTIALRRNREDEPRSNSFRRSRDSKDSTDSYTPYLRRDRIDRNAISLNDPSSSLGSSSGITRSQSMRTRMRNGELESRIEEKSNDSDSKGDKDGRRESSALPGEGREKSDGRQESSPTTTKMKKKKKIKKKNLPMIRLLVGMGDTPPRRTSPIGTAPAPTQRPPSLRQLSTPL